MVVYRKCYRQIQRHRRGCNKTILIQPEAQGRFLSPEESEWHSQRDVGSGLGGRAGYSRQREEPLPLCLRWERSLAPFRKIKGSWCDCSAGSEKEHGKGDFESCTAFLRATY